MEEEELIEEKILTSKAFHADPEPVVVEEPKPKPKPKPKVVKKVKVERKKKEIYIDDAKEILEKIEGLIDAITKGISIGNANSAYNSLQTIIKEYKKKIL